jgi:hypothetical protein
VGDAVPGGVVGSNVKVGVPVVSLVLHAFIAIACGFTTWIGRAITEQLHFEGAPGIASAIPLEVNG